ncbi:hypothetical protein DO72_5943 [Burkholderia pseudomallei]|nr:hypothetical protein DO72_5943 [Burkholderia pseudomallei]
MQFVNPSHQQLIRCAHRPVAGNTRSISLRRRDGPAAQSATCAYGRSFLCAQQSRLVERAA